MCGTTGHRGKAPEERSIAALGEAGWAIAKRRGERPRQEPTEPCEGGRAAELPGDRAQCRRGKRRKWTRRSGGDAVERHGTEV